MLSMVRVALVVMSDVALVVMLAPKEYPAVKSRDRGVDGIAVFVSLQNATRAAMMTAGSWWAMVPVPVVWGVRLSSGARRRSREGEPPRSLEGDRGRSRDAVGSMDLPRLESW